MAAVDDGFAGSGVIGMLQLLLAFIACTGYAVAQGGLLGKVGRRIGWTVSVLAAAALALHTGEWSRTAVLGAVVVAGLGVFIVLVWLTSRLLGLDRTPTAIGAVDTDPVGASPAAAGRTRPTPLNGPAHSI